MPEYTNVSDFSPTITRVKRRLAAIWNCIANLESIQETDHDWDNLEFRLQRLYTVAYELEQELAEATVY